MPASRGVRRPVLAPVAPDRTSRAAPGARARRRVAEPAQAVGAARPDLPRGRPVRPADLRKRATPVTVPVTVGWYRYSTEGRRRTREGHRPESSQSANHGKAGTVG